MISLLHTGFKVYLSHCFYSELILTGGKIKNKTQSIDKNLSMYTIFSV